MDHRGSAHDEGKVQRQQRVCVRSKFQDPSECVCFNPALLGTSSLMDFPTACFTKHQIDRLVPVEALIKCKMQDNLEFLQWTKRFWDQYYPGGDYDALGRRKASGAPAPTAPPATSSRTSGVGAARRGVTPTSTTAARTPRAPGVAAASAALVAENGQLKDTVAGLERERDFYFSKLRDIELLLQQAVEANPEIEKDENGLIKHVQAILYSTEVSAAVFRK